MLTLFWDYSYLILFFSVNDYGIEGPGPKADAILHKAIDLKGRGILDAVGFQCHFSVGKVPQGKYQDTIL
jgi:endo-1,4-beta-xylanase